MSTLRPLLLAAVFGTALGVAPSSAQADDVYWTTKSLLKEFFKTSDRVSYVKVYTETCHKDLQAKLGYVPKKSTYVVFVAKTGGEVDGYAIIDEEMGQHEPITFGVKLDAAGEVERLEVMVYREGYGDEIREGRFRRQFERKGPEDAIRFGEDVVAISGATISSKSMAIGVRRAVALVDVARAQVTAPVHASSGTPKRGAP